VNDLNTSASHPRVLSFFLKRSLRGGGGGDVKWHQRSTAGGNNEEEALGSSYTATNVTGRTVWPMGWCGRSAGEVILTGLIQQEEDGSTDRRRHKVTPGLQRRVHLEYLSGGSHPLPPLGDADVLRIILYTKSQNPRSTGVSLRPAKLQRKIAVNQGGVWTHGPAERKADVPFYMFAIKVKTSISNAAASILCLCLPKETFFSLLHK